MLRANKKMAIAAVAGMVVAAMLAAKVAHALQAVPDTDQVPSYAQNVFLDFLFGGDDKKKKKKKQIASYYINSDEKFTEENTQVVNVRPFNSSTLEFFITLPRNWESADLTRNMPMSNAATEQRAIADVASIKSEMIGVHRIQVSIQTQPVKQEMSAENWLKHYIFTNGHAIEGQVEGRGPREAAAYFNSMLGQTNVFTYVVVRITGNVAMLTRADVPLQIKKQTKYIQKKVVDSLRFAYPREDGVEAYKAFALVDALRFEYPVSWTQVNPDFKDLSRLSIQLISNDKNGAVNGFIRIFAIRRLTSTSLKQEMETLNKHFSEYMNIDIKKMLDSSEIERVNPRFKFSRLETYTASYQKEGMQDPEVRLAVAGDKSWYIIIYLVSPKEENNLYDWAHNVRSLEVITETMR